MSARIYQILQGILPAGLAGPEEDRPSLLSTGEGIRTLMLPGVRCAICAANGEEVWVIPGRACGYCRTPAPVDNHEGLVNEEEGCAC